MAAAVRALRRSERDGTCILAWIMTPCSLLSQDSLLQYGSSTVESVGTLAKFGGRMVGLVLSGRGLKFFGEALRQGGTLLLCSTPLICGMARVLGLVRPARGDALRVRLHDVGEGGHGAGGGDRRDADHRRDRRARGDGHQLDDVPVRDASARGVDGA